MAGRTAAVIEGEAPDKLATTGSSAGLSMRHPRVAFALSAAFYVLLTVALTWPLMLHPGSVVPNDLGDSLLNTFLLAWNARVVPLTERWWNLPQFYPVEGAMAFSEHLLGLSLLATPVIWATGNVLLAYNAAFFLSFPLCALGAHGLCYALTRRHDASLIAGIAYGFAPYRMGQFAHVQVLSAYWIPLALLGLHLCLRRGEWKWAALFAVSWWLQSLANGYHLFYVSVLVAIWLIWFVVASRRWLVLGRILVTWTAAGLAMVPVALGYLHWQRRYGMRRWPDEIQGFSADVLSLLTASGNLRLWKSLNVVDRPESQLFPGFTLIALIAAGAMLAWAAAARIGYQRLRAPRILLVLAALFGFAATVPHWYGPWVVEVFGLRLLSVRTPQKPLSIALLLAVAAMAMHPSMRAAWRRRSPLAFFTIAALVMWLFSLGPAPTLMNEPLLYKAPYSWLMLLPGVEGVRVPARFWVLSTICLAMAGGLAFLHVAARWPSLARVLPAVLAGLMLIEAWPEPLPLHAPPAPRPVRTRADLRLEVPSTGGYDLVALYRAAEHRRPLLNGYSGYFAPHYWALQSLLASHDPGLLRYLSTLGSLEIVVDHDREGSSRFNEFLTAYPAAELVYRDSSHSVFRVPRTSSTYEVPRFSSEPLPVAGIRATLNEAMVAHMTDGDRVSRWHTGGPQKPGDGVVVDLGGAKPISGIEMLIGGYIADFPRGLTIEISDDGQAWRPASSSSPGIAALSGALAEPLEVPLRFPLSGAAGRFIRLRQTGSDPVFHWTIAELRVY